MPCLPKGYEISSDPPKGPCRNDECGTEACVSARLLARSLCQLCGAPIGFNSPFYFEEVLASRRRLPATRISVLVVVHAKCGSCPEPWVHSDPFGHLLP